MDLDLGLGSPHVFWGHCEFFNDRPRVVACVWVGVGLRVGLGLEVAVRLGLTIALFSPNTVLVSGKGACWFSTKSNHSLTEAIPSSLTAAYLGQKSPRVMSRVTMRVSAMGQRSDLQPWVESCLRPWSGLSLRLALGIQRDHRVRVRVRVRFWAHNFRLAI